MATSPVGKRRLSGAVFCGWAASGFVVLATGANGQFTAATDGVAWLKINDPPGELDDNEGQLAVSLGPE